MPSDWIIELMWHADCVTMGEVAVTRHNFYIFYF